MTILSAATIRRLDLVHPCPERGIIRGRSYGLSGHGYDARVAETFYLEPGEFRLASTIERFRLPRDVCGLVKNKSSWVRRGLNAANDTVLEAGWEGYLTLEIMNHGYERLRITEYDPIVQILFERLDEETQPYNGKYQDQESGPQEARYEV